MSGSRFAILLDGAFVIKKFENLKRRFPTAQDIQRLCDGIMQLDALHARELLRIYFYHAQPAEGVLVNPIDKSKLDLACSEIKSQHRRLLDSLELHPNFALRLGELVTRDWRIGPKALAELRIRPRMIEARDFVPNISQKGVDLRIGLDIARLSLRRLVDIVVVVTGDSDLVPAFRFARREGLRVYLDHLGHGVSRSLRAHADLTLPNALAVLPDTARKVANLD